MKRTIEFLALFLAFVMLLGMSMGCQKQGSEAWVAPAGMTTHYANKISGKAPTIDGTIGKGEYDSPIRVDEPRVIDLAQRVWLDSQVKADLASEYMEFYFSYDEDYIYIAIHDAGPEFIDNNDSCSQNDIPYRNNYRFEFGFDLLDTDSYFMFEGGSTSTAWTTLNCYKNGVEVTHSLKSYNLISESLIHKYQTDSHGKVGDYISYGDIGAGNGNGNYTAGKWAVVMEFKLDKKEIVDVVNEVYGTEYEELSNAMWFSLTSKGYKAKLNDLEDKYEPQEVRWIGQNEHFLDLVVFGDKNTEIMAADPYAGQENCPNGHATVLHTAKTPTYDEVGFEAYRECEKCGYTTYTEIPKIENVFRTGYARVDITPRVSPSKPLVSFTNVRDELYATCVALNDGEKTVLLLSVDMKSIPTSICDEIRSYLNKETDVPTDNIFISATHDHSVAPFENNRKWALESVHKMGDAAKEAISDLSDTDMYIGTGKTTGMAWVRRYINGNGQMSSISPANFSDVTTRSVSEADDSLQTVRFVREDKKDIVLINWQGHLAHAVNHFPNSISADMAHYIREDVEAGDKDTLVAYFAGASGNLNLNAPNSALAEYENASNPISKNNYYANVAKALANVTLETIEEKNLTKIGAGRIAIEKRVYAAQQKQDDPADVAAAQARLDEGGNAAADRYMVVRNKSKTRDLRISAISVGDLAFVTVPYEMFDNNGLQIKEGSPFKMTFVLTNSDGDYAYMPSYEACTEYGGYETEASYFGAGTAENLVAQYLEMLNGLNKVR